jgi:hypothetical protein
MGQVDVDQFQQIPDITLGSWSLVVIQVDPIMYLLMVIQNSLGLIQQSIQTTSYGVRVIIQQVKVF